jgi:peptide/nickel transport system substrate-binding protein
MIPGQPSPARRRQLLAAAAAGTTALLGGAAAPGGRPGGTLDALLAPEPPALLPGISNEMPSLLVLSKIFQGLVRPGGGPEPEGELAQSWEIEADRRSLTFHLRPGVLWQDGAPFTAADVAFSLIEVHRRHSPRLAPLLREIAAVETPDPHTVRLRLLAPIAPLLLIDGVAMPLLPRHCYASATAARARQPVGCGPFTLAEWQPGAFLRLARNSRYWKPGRPYLDGIVWYILPGSDRRARALELGRAAFACGDALDPMDIARLREMPGLRQDDGGAAWLAPLVTLELNHRLPPLADLRVRLAISHAIDRDSLAAGLWSGTARPARSPLASHTPLFDPGVQLPRYDPARAVRLLDSAGLRPQAGGVRLRLRHLVLPYGAVWARLSAALAAALAEVGIVLVCEHADPASWAARLAAWDYDTTVSYVCQWGDPSLGVERSYSASMIRHVAFTNTGGFADAKLDGLFALARASADTGERQGAWRAAQHRLAELAAQVWLFELPLPAVWRRALHGVDAASGGAFASFDAVFFAPA